MAERPRSMQHSLQVLYDRLQEVMPLLQDAVRAEEAREAARPYGGEQTAVSATSETESHYRIERYKNTRNWALYDGDELVTVTVYKRGAESVKQRLKALEQRLAELYPSNNLEPPGAVARLNQERTSRGPRGR